MFSRQVQEGVFLRVLEERYAEQIFAVVDRERAYLRQWLPWVDATHSVEDSRAFIKQTLKQFARGDGFVAGIWCGNEFAGTIGTHKLDRLNRKVEIGYWIAARFQRRGIVTSACRAVIDHAFQEWELNRVEIHCAPQNRKSCAIPERLGFQREALLREAQLLDGRYVDSVVYGILAREWRVGS